MYTISRWIYAALDIQFLCKSGHSVHILCTQFLVEFTKFWIFNFSTKPDIPYIYCTQFSLNLRSSRYSIYLQIQTVRTCNVHNFPCNLCYSGFSIYLQIQTFRTYNVHNFLSNLYISRYPISLQIQIFRTYKMYTIPAEFKKFSIFNFSTKPDIPYIYCTQFPIKFTKFRMFNLFENPDSSYI